MRTLLALALASTFAVSATAATPSSAPATDTTAFQRQTGDSAIPHRRGKDDPVGHRFSIDTEPTFVARRGADNPAGDQRRGRGKDDPAGHRVAPESLDASSLIAAASRSTVA